MNKDTRNFKKPHIEKYLSKNIRYDGRAKDQFRELNVETGLLSTAEGSARVTLGNTEVIAGVKMELGTPYSDNPDEGTIMVGAEFLPMASVEFESGPPGEEAIELARVVDRGIRESESIDLKKLCIKSGEKMWIISVDVCTINDDGNLLDVSGIAALAAIENAVFPKLIEVGDGRLEIDYKSKTKDKVPIVKRPIPITVYKVNGEFLVDPIPDEEALSTARLTITTTEDGKLCSLQKGNEGPINADDISTMIDLALKCSKELRSKF